MSAPSAEIRDGVITDPAAVVAELDQAWANGQVRNWRDEPHQPFRGSKHDQETVGVNPYWDIVRRLPCDTNTMWSGRTRVEPYVARAGVNAGYLMTRDRLTKSYAWSIPSPQDIAWIAALLDGRGVIEIGAGTGYWAWQLSQANVDVLAYDSAPFGNQWCTNTQYHPVHEGGPEKAAGTPDRALFLCWPPYDDPMAVATLRAYAGDLLIYAGEGAGGCTGDDEFHGLLAADWTEIGDSPGHVTFSGIHCHLTAYRRGARKAAAR